MGMNITYKILKEHLREGKLQAGSEIGISIDQTLTQDATGTTCFLLFESMGIDRIRTKLSVSYVDHNLSQFGPENHNDHLYLQSISRKVGCWHSRPGNGICHQVHLERFARPGWTLIGSDSHTPTAGGIGSLAIGAGGLDVAVAMAGGLFYLTCPRVIGVHLKGRLQPWVSSKDIILKLLSILTTKGNVGYVIEYFGEALRYLSVPQRATCANMGAELGVTTSIFPSDQITKAFLRSQKRESDWIELQPDEDAEYDRIIEIDLDKLEPLIALPGSPDNVVELSKVEGRPVRQVVIGSCTNSSFRDLMIVAKALEGKKVHEDVELGIAPGSRQVLSMIDKAGGLYTLIKAGARILECGCGPCIGMGFSPADGTISVRSFNRNFPGRSGTPNDTVYLASPEVCVAAAITGRLTDPRRLGIEYPKIGEPDHFEIDDNMLQPPLPVELANTAEVIKPPTIVTPPLSQPLPDPIEGNVLIKLKDKVSTDIIMPAGPFLKYRSNIPEYAKYVFNSLNEPGRPTFAERALALRSQGRAGIIVASESYGQGSSREHAALCPMYLGIKAVIARSIERIHFANLINFAILPILFANPADYEGIETNDAIRIDNIRSSLEGGKDRIIIKNITKGIEFEGILNLTNRQRKILLAGGLLRLVKSEYAQ